METRTGGVRVLALSRIRNIDAVGWEVLVRLSQSTRRLEILRVESQMLRARLLIGAVEAGEEDFVSVRGYVLAAGDVLDVERRVPID